MECLILNKSGIKHMVYISNDDKLKVIIVRQSPKISSIRLELDTTDFIDISNRLDNLINLDTPMWEFLSDLQKTQPPTEP